MPIYTVTVTDELGSELGQYVAVFNASKELTTPPITATSACERFIADRLRALAGETRERENGDLVRLYAEATPAKKAEVMVSLTK